MRNFGSVGGNATFLLKFLCGNRGNLYLFVVKYLNSKPLAKKLLS
jgi:hypothetical protein